MRYKIELAYDGTHFGGWQIQPNTPTIQAAIDQALCQVCNTPIETMGCGRTDAGVHANYFVAHFDGPEQIPEGLTHRLNKMLPASIVIFSIEPIHATFHARFDATIREYEYHICSNKNPFSADFTWTMPHALDLVKMNRCANQMIGKKLFGAFCKGEIPNNNPQCNVYIAEWKKTDLGYCFTIQANRFLRNMVRAIVGTLVDVGNGKITESQFQSIFESNNRNNVAHAAPASGLFLTKVEYPTIP